MFITRNALAGRLSPLYCDQNHSAWNILLPPCRPELALRCSSPTSLKPSTAESTGLVFYSAHNTSLSLTHTRAHTCAQAYTSFEKFHTNWVRHTRVGYELQNTQRGPMTANQEVCSTAYTLPMGPSAMCV